MDELKKRLTEISKLSSNWFFGSLYQPNYFLFLFQIITSSNIRKGWKALSLENVTGWRKSVFVRNLCLLIILVSFIIVLFLYLGHRDHREYLTFALYQSDLKGAYTTTLEELTGTQMRVQRMIDENSNISSNFFKKFFKFYFIFFRNSNNETNQLWKIGVEWARSLPNAHPVVICLRAVRYSTIDSSNAFGLGCGPARS